MPRDVTPPRTPRRETRQQWTIKHASLTPELRAQVSRAASQQGMPVGQWIAYVLSDRAQAVLRGDSEPQAGVPAVPPQRIDDLEQRVAELAEAVRALTAKRGWWARLLGR
jgi:hypothetical protein